MNAKTKTQRGSEGFTGLEASLILLAFIVVSAVFAYVILGVGFFTIQKSNQVIYSAIEQSSSTITIDNDVYAKKNESTDKFDIFMFNMRSPYSIVDSDLTKMTIAFATTSGMTYLIKSDPLYAPNSDPSVNHWSIVKSTMAGDKKTLLAMGEYATVSLHVPENLQVSLGEKYYIEVVEPLGVSVMLSKIA